MTKTYSELRQEAYFRAARDMRKIAAEVLDDVQGPVECASMPTVSWAVDKARATAEKANELERLGHEECIASRRQESLNGRSRDAYSASIDAFERRVRDAGGGLGLPGAGDRIHPANDRSLTYRT